jgi:predicted nucleic acid-binding protein
MYLVDTNVWVEAFLGQQKTKEAADFLKRVSPARLFITDYTIFSIGIILTKLDRGEVFGRFLQDVLIGNPVRVIRHMPLELNEVPKVSKRFKLDFDDAYQYVAARSNGMELVSFDADFDRTDITRKSPRAIIDRLGEFDSGSPGAHEAPARAYGASAKSGSAKAGEKALAPQAAYKAHRPKSKTRRRKKK